MKKIRMLLCLILTALLTLSLAAPALAADVPYLEKIPGGQPIYTGPGYAYNTNGTVPENGTFTIVAESRDGSGRLWGKLKSGAGWVDLTDVRGESAFSFADTITVTEATRSFLESGAYHEYIHDDSDYTTWLVFRASGIVENVQLVSFELTDAGMQVDEVLYAMPELHPSLPLVAGVVFYGDMTTYGLMCTDADGHQRCYTVSISGYDGSLTVSECALVASYME